MYFPLTISIVLFSSSGLLSNNLFLDFRDKGGKICESRSKLDVFPDFICSVLT